MDDHERARQDLGQKAGVVLRMGELMLASGTGSYRVKEAMQLVATAVGIDRFDAHVTLTEITTTVHFGDEWGTKVAEIRRLGVNTDRIEALDRLVRALRPGTTVQQVHDELDRIEARGHRYPVSTISLGAAVACTAFAFLNNGDAIDCAAVFSAAGLGQAVRATLLRRHLNQFGVTMLASLIATAVYLALLRVLAVFAGDGTTHEAGFISAVLFLVPGFPVVTAVLDLAKLDFSAGMARLTYAFMILFAAALSVWGVSWAAGVTTVPTPPPQLGLASLSLLRAIASILGVAGFAIMFSTRPTTAVAAGVIGMAANLVRLSFIDAGVTPQPVTMLAALLVGVLAGSVAKRMGAPRITLSVPAVLIMLPGAAAYRALVFAQTQQFSDALANGLNAFVILVSIGIGLALARMVTDREWAFEK